MTMDAAAMQERLHVTRGRVSSASSLGERGDSLEDITEMSHLPSSSNQAKSVETSTVAKPTAASTGASVEEVKKLREELGEVKNKLVDITQVK